MAAKPLLLRRGTIIDRVGLGMVRPRRPVSKQVEVALTKISSVMRGVDYGWAKLCPTDMESESFRFPVPPLEILPRESHMKGLIEKAQIAQKRKLLVPINALSRAQRAAGLWRNTAPSS